jgi:hypothetical protein
VQLKAKSGFDILDFRKSLNGSPLSSPAILSLLQTIEFEKGKTFALPESKRLSWNFILFFIEAKILPLEDIEKKQPGCQLRGPRSCLEVPSLMGNWRKPGAVR